MTDNHPGDGDANRLKTYWTKDPEGLAKWRNHPHPWTALYRHLKKHMPDEMAKRVASEWFHEVFGYWPGDARHRKKVAAATDWPTDTATDSEEDAVPSPHPSRADLIREAWNSSSAPHSQWIVELDPDAGEVIVIDDTSRDLHRVPVTVDGDTVTFGPPAPVRMAYVPADAEPVAASRTVFASRAESRPVLAAETPADLPEPPNDPTHTPSQGTPPNAAPEPAEPVPTSPGAPAAPVVPAAEPVPPTDPEGGTDVSLSEIRSRLGLDETADEAAVLAALDELKTKASTPAEPAAELVAAAAANEQRFAAAIGQIETLSTELAQIKAEKAATVKASFFAAAISEGRIAPAEREAYEADYDKAPEVVTRIVSARAVGSAVPVAAAGYTGDPEPTADLDAEFAGFFPPGVIETSGKGA